ncbi:SDR family oxidoreductase [Rhodoferax sp. GW822-FHT02A01]|uniref:SDR family oxidoreductase n=1 Tax=Rhodoferax sp. GW822-FHT02A01 TaxID=3141537 RepID=UPI00315D00D8
MNRFEGKNILVTGGSSGIGAAAAIAFAREGARVAITGRDAEGLARVKAELGPNALALVSEAGDVSAQTALVAELQAQMGVIDGVFINAGTAKFGPLAQIDEALWDSSFDTNVKGPYFLIQRLAALMPRGGAIVLNGSINAHIGMPNSSVYAASKAALISLAKTLSAELLPQGVRVNVVSPGPVTTPLYGKLGLSPDQLQTMATSIQTQVPLGRFGTPEEIAATVLHLVSKESAFIVGTEIIADGGMSQM